MEKGCQGSRGPLDVKLSHQARGDPLRPLMNQGAAIRKRAFDLSSSAFMPGPQDIWR